MQDDDVHWILEESAKGDEWSKKDDGASDPNDGEACEDDGCCRWDDWGEKG
jgi:hypothetical protein